MKIGEHLINNYKEGKHDPRFRAEEYLRHVYNSYQKYMILLGVEYLGFSNWLGEQIKPPLNKNDK